MEEAQPINERGYSVTGDKNFVVSEVLFLLFTLTILQTLFHYSIWFIQHDFVIFFSFIDPPLSVFDPDSFLSAFSSCHKLLHEILINKVSCLITSYIK